MDDQETRELVRWLKGCCKYARQIRQEHVKAMKHGEIDAHFHYDFARGYLAAYENVLWKLQPQRPRGTKVGE